MNKTLFLLSLMGAFSALVDSLRAIVERKGSPGGAGRLYGSYNTGNDLCICSAV